MSLMSPTGEIEEIEEIEEIQQEAFVIIGASSKIKTHVEEIKVNDSHMIEKINLVKKIWHRANESFLPKPTELESGIDYYFIDPLPRTIELGLGEKNKLEILSNEPNAFVSDNVNKTLEHIRKKYQKITIIDYFGYKTVANFLYQTRWTFNDSETYHLNLKSKVKLSKLPKPLKYYNFYSGKKVPSLPEDENVEQSIYILARILQKYLICGFHLGKMISPEKINFELNLGIPEMDLFLRYFGLYPVPEDEKEEYQHDFMSNINYRQVVTEMLARVLSNYIVNNTKSKSNKWFEPETYNILIQ